MVRLLTDVDAVYIVRCRIRFKLPSLLRQGLALPMTAGHRPSCGVRTSAERSNKSQSRVEDEKVKSSAWRFEVAAAGGVWG